MNGWSLHRRVESDVACRSPEHRRGEVVGVNAVDVEVKSALLRRGNSCSVRS